MQNFIDGAEQFKEKHPTLGSFGRHVLRSIGDHVTRTFTTASTLQQKGNSFQAGMLYGELGYNAALVAGGIGGGLTLTKPVLKFAGRSGVTLARETALAIRDFSPIVFQFETGRTTTLYSGFPIDAIKFRNPLIKKPTSLSSREYAPSIKHESLRPGHSISFNPIPDAATGQALLDSAYMHTSAKQVYNIYQGKLIKFQPDNVGGWHAYEVTSGTTTSVIEQVPPSVLFNMYKDGLISKPVYKKWLKNKG